MARLMAMMIKIQENQPILGLNLHNIRFPLIEPLTLSEVLEGAKKLNSVKKPFSPSDLKESQLISWESKGRMLLINHFVN